MLNHDHQTNQFPCVIVRRVWTKLEVKHSPQFIVHYVSMCFSILLTPIIYLHIILQKEITHTSAFLKKNKTYFFMLAFNKSLLLFLLLLPFRSLLSMLLSLFARSLVSVTTSRTSASQIKFSSLESRELAATRFEGLFISTEETRRGSELFRDAVPPLTPLSHLITLCSHALEHTFPCTHWHFPPKVRYHGSSPGTLPYTFPIALQRRLQLPLELLCVSLSKPKRQTLQL